MFDWQKIIKLALAIALIPCAVLLAVIGNEWRVDHDFHKAWMLLSRARSQAMYTRTGPVTVRFNDHKATVENQDGKVIESLSLPTLTEVRFKTIRGDRQVVFAAGGGQTNPFNIHLHGGDFTFKGWTGYSRSIWIHCTGGMTIVRNNDWVLK